ncbi:MAG: peptide ABC transporter substrate-binding protein [Anaerolineales bacterium]
MASPLYSIKKYFAVLIISLAIGCSSNAVQETENLDEFRVEPTATFFQNSPSFSSPTPPTLVQPNNNSRSLTICMSSIPTTLYPYDGTDLSKTGVLEAIFDGPIDQRAFGYYPIILQNVPSLADRTASIQSIKVQLGDKFVDAEGFVGVFQIGSRFLPTGCNTLDCVVEYDGSGEVYMDQLLVKFQLLPNVKWSDGFPVTAGDSIYSFKLASDPETPTDKFKVDRTASYTALDELTIQWIGLPGFLDQTYFLNFWTPYPKHIWGKYTAHELLWADVSAIKPIGWGPYMIEEVSYGTQEGDYIRLGRNPFYFRANEGLPKFDTLIFRFIGDNANANISALLSGGCDILDQGASSFLSQTEDVIELNLEQKINIHFIAGTVWEHLDFSLQPSETWQGFSSSDAFQDVRLRQAIALCLDRQRIIDEVFSGQSFVPDSYLPSDHPLFNPNLPSYAFDIRASSVLLDEIGWVDDDGDSSTPRIYQGNNANIPQGTQLEFNYWTTTTEERTKVSRILSESLAQCGIKANVQQWAPDEFFKEGPDGPLYSRQFDVAQFASLTSELPPCDLWLTENIPGDPTLVDDYGNPIYPIGWNGTNFSGYNNYEYDQACHTALSLLPGQPGYVEAHLQAQEIFAHDLPIIPLYARVKLAVTRPDMCGFRMDSTADSELWNIEEFDYGPSCK